MSSAIASLLNDTQRIAIITGASSGIGREAAIALSAAGWIVVLFGRRETELHATAQMCRWESLVLPGDVTKEADVVELFKQTIKQFGRLDMLFNNAGMSSPSTPLDELTLDTFTNILNINVTGTFLCTKEAFKVFKSQSPPGGRIINNGSISAYTPRIYSAAYTASKHAVLGLTKSTALDGRAHNITCTQIDIGNAETSMASGHAVGTLQANGQIAIEPMMDPLHVANAVVHIANLPLGVTVLQMNIMATGMPYVGRG